MTRQKIRAVIAKLHAIARVGVLPIQSGVAKDTLKLLNWIAANGDSYQDHLLERAIYAVELERRKMRKEKGK